MEVLQHHETIPRSLGCCEDGDTVGCCECEVREWAKGFYQSRAWKNTRHAYLDYRHHLCERCNNAAEIVHHIKWLNPNNIGDIAVTLDWSNLQCVCRECHALIHEGVRATVDGLKFNDAGEVVRVCPYIDE